MWVFFLLAAGVHATYNATEDATLMEDTENPSVFEQHKLVLVGAMAVAAVVAITGAATLVVRKTSKAAPHRRSSLSQSQALLAAASILGPRGATPEAALVPAPTGGRHGRRRSSCSGIELAVPSPRPSPQPEEETAVTFMPSPTPKRSATPFRKAMRAREESRLQGGIERGGSPAIVRQKAQRRLSLSISWNRLNCFKRSARDVDSDDDEAGVLITASAVAPLVAAPRPKPRLANVYVDDGADDASSHTGSFMSMPPSPTNSQLGYSDDDGFLTDDAP